MNTDKLVSRLKEDYVEGLIDTGSISFSKETRHFNAGSDTRIYIDHRRLLTGADHLKTIAGLLHELLKPLNKPLYLVNSDSPMSRIIVGAMAALYNYKFINIDYRQKVEPSSHSPLTNLNADIALVDDVIASGDTIRRSKEFLKLQGIMPSHVIAGSYRDESLTTTLKEQGLCLLGGLSFREIVNLSDSLL